MGFEGFVTIRWQGRSRHKSVHRCTWVCLKIIVCTIRKTMERTSRYCFPPEEGVLNSQTIRHANAIYQLIHMASIDKLSIFWVIVVHPVHVTVATLQTIDHDWCHTKQTAYSPAPNEWFRAYSTCQYTIMFYTIMCWMKSKGSQSNMDEQKCENQRASIGFGDCFRTLTVCDRLAGVWMTAVGSITTPPCHLGKQVDALCVEEQLSCSSGVRTVNLWRDLGHVIEWLSVPPLSKRLRDSICYSS